MKAGTHEARNLLAGDRVDSGSVVLDCVSAEPGFVLVSFRRADGTEDAIRLHANRLVEVNS